MEFTEKNVSPAARESMDEAKAWLATHGIKSADDLLGAKNVLLIRSLGNMGQTDLGAELYTGSMAAAGNLFATMYKEADLFRVLLAAMGEDVPSSSFLMHAFLLECVCHFFDERPELREELSLYVHKSSRELTEDSIPELLEDMLRKKEAEGNG